MISQAFLTLLGAEFIDFSPGWTEFILDECTFFLPHTTPVFGSQLGEFAKLNCV